MNPRIVIDGWFDGYIHGHLSDDPKCGIGTQTLKELVICLERAIEWKKRIEEYRVSRVTFPDTVTKSNT